MVDQSAGQLESSTILVGKNLVLLYENTIVDELLE